jgi:uncharacterized protein (DUF2164 family)
MTIELHKDVRAEAIKSIERWFQVHREERIGNIQAGALYAFFVEEIGPSLYNKGVADAQERMQMRASELDIECHEDEFGYWAKQERPAKSPRGRSTP